MPLAYRDGFILPLKSAPQGKILLMPDGRILLRPPGGSAFEAWLAELPARLRETDLSRVPRKGNPDPKRGLTSLGQPKPVGTRRYLAEAA